MSISGVSATGGTQGRSPLGAMISKLASAVGGVDADGDHDGSGKAAATAKPAAASPPPAPTTPVPGSTITRYA